MLGPKGKVKQPWQIFVTTKEKYQNASAGSASLSVAGPEAKGIPDSYVAKLWNEGKVLNHLDVAMANKDEYPYGDYAYSEVKIGQNFGAAKKDAIDGWWVDADTPVPSDRLWKANITTISAQAWAWNSNAIWQEAVTLYGQG